MASRKQFVQSAGATCRNWTWSWSFINEAERSVIFGFWKDLEKDGRALICARSWESRNGKRNTGFAQSLDHLRRVSEEGFRLRIFRQVRRDLGVSDAGPAQVESFEPVLINASLVDDGQAWWAVFDPSSQGEKIRIIGNPDWTEDELVLALDLYVRVAGRIPSESSPDIVDLSNLLRLLNQRMGIKGNSSFRNTNGVHMKLMNFRRMDPTFGAGGLSAGAELEEAVWVEFHGHPEKLRAAAQQIRSFLNTSIEFPERDVDDTEDNDNYEAREGGFLTRIHRSRERDPKIVDKKKKRAIRKHGSLRCEVCSFDFQEQYGERGAHFIECHHLKPVSTLNPDDVTTADDLALLCSNCHRMIHRRQPMLSIDDLRRLLSERRAVSE